MNKSLQDITDNSLFERICVELLRPQNAIYSKLIHSGSNEKGKTIPDPVDGISIIQSDAGAITHAIVLECTAIERSKLRGKLLKLKSPKGDIIKSIEKLNEISSNKIKKKIILCSNRSISSELTVELNKKCEDCKIEIDIWDFSRLNYELENTPHGQFTSYKHFGTRISIPSPNLLSEFIEKNILDYKTEFNHYANSITRDIQKALEYELFNFEGLIILKGESGTGKTTICIQMMEILIEQDINIVRLSPDNIINSASLLIALDNEIKKYYPNLQTTPHHLFFSNKLVIIVDDINKSSSPQLILDKIEQWFAQIKQDGRLNCVFLCPLWNRNVTYMPIKYENSKTLKEYTLSTYSKEERKLFQLQINPNINQQLLDDLGNDPFLIGIYHLNNLTTSKPEKVIEEFIVKKISIVANTNNIFVEEIWLCLDTLIKNQLRNKNLFPAQSQLISYLDRNGIKTIKLLEEEGSILHFVSNSSNEKILKFRHDRIHEFFIKRVFLELLEEKNIDESIIFNPFYSEYIGKVLSNLPFNEEQLELILKHQPIIGIYAVKEIGEPKNENQRKICERVILWFKNYSTSTNKDCALYKSIIDAIYDVQSSVVNKLSDFLNNDLRKFTIKFNNGDLQYSLHYFASHIDYEPGGINQHRNQMLKKYKFDLKEKSLEYVKSILLNPDYKPLAHKSALIFAGYLGFSDLVAPIINCYNQSLSKKEIISQAIWAVLNCCYENLTKTIKPLFDFWASLPDDDHDFSSRMAVCEQIRHSIGTINNPELESTIIYYFNHLPALKSYFYLFIEQIKTPSAIEIYVNTLAETHENNLNNKNQLGMLQLRSRFAFDNGEVTFYKKDVSDKLETIWKNNPDNSIGLYAFLLWIKSIGKNQLDKLRAIPSDSQYYSKALYRRLHLNDRTVINDFFPFLQKEHFRLSQKIWSEKTFKKIKQELETNPKYVASDYLLSIPENHAEILLEIYAQYLVNDPFVFKYGLYIGTPKTIKISKTIFDDTTDKKNLFKYISNVFSTLDSSRVKNLSIEKLNNLLPYLDYISTDDFHHLVSECLTNNLFDWAKSNLKEYLKSRESSEGSLFKPTPFLTDEEILTNYFDSCRCKCNKYCHLNFWIDKLERRGYTKEDFKALLLNELSKLIDIERFQDICEYLKESGSREDIPIIKKFTLTGFEQRIAEILEDVIYSIEKRSLV